MTHIEINDLFQLFRLSITKNKMESHFGDQNELKYNKYERLRIKIKKIYFRTNMKLTHNLKMKIAILPIYLYIFLKNLTVL